MYAKLFSSITESSLWSEPKEVRLLFVTMLAKADQTGFVEASLPGLARVANLTMEETAESLQCLMSPDVNSKNPDNEGRRIVEVPGGYMLLNYEDYRSRRNVSERQEYMREYMREYRKQHVNKSKRQLTVVNAGKPPLAQAEAEAEADITAGAVIPPEQDQSPKETDAVPWGAIVDAVDGVTGTKSRWTAKRKVAAKARWADKYWRENWREAVERAAGSSFLTGQNDRGWVMDLEFFLRPDTVTKILEGKYDDREIHHATKPSAAQQREAANGTAFTECFAAINAINAASSGRGVTDTQSRIGVSLYGEGPGSVHNAST